MSSAEVYHLLEEEPWGLQTASSRPPSSGGGGDSALLARWAVLVFTRRASHCCASCLGLAMGLSYKHHSLLHVDSFNHVPQMDSWLRPLHCSSEHSASKWPHSSPPPSLKPLLGCHLPTASTEISTFWKLAHFVPASLFLSYHRSHLTMHTPSHGMQASDSEGLCTST